MIATLDIEETKKFVEFGIIVFNENGRKTYFRPRKLTDEEKKEHIGDFEYELEPVSNEEKQKLGIEESEAQQGSELEIEESEGEEPTEEQKQKAEELKKRLTLSGSPEVVQSAKAILEKEMAKKNNNDLATLKLKMYEKFNHNPMFLDAPDKNTLEAMVENYVNTAIEKDKGKSAGSAPANAQQYGIKPENLYSRKFYDSQEMVSELRRLTHEGNPQERAESEHYLNELFKKYALDKRANPTRPEPSTNPNTPESLLELDLVQKDGVLQPRNKESGDLQKLQAKWRAERQRRMGEN
jgi:hypothetical protein